MGDYDDLVLDVFLEKQLQLFPEEVAFDREEAAEFLADCFAVVVNSPKEVWKYFEEAEVDMEGADIDGILEADEVFEIGDGRYLIVEG